MKRAETTLLALLLLLGCASRAEKSTEDSSRTLDSGGSTPANAIESALAPADPVAFFAGQVPPLGALARDPFSVDRPRSGSSLSSAPASAGNAARTGLKLQGILDVEGMRRAMISGHTLRVGESVAGWQISSIGAQTVTLRRGDTVQTLSLAP